MKRIAILSTMCWLGILCMGFQTNLKADEFNKKTIFTFSAPVEIPGRVLDPGTYVFKRVDDPIVTTQPFIQILNQDQDQVLATVMVIPVYSPTIPDEPTVKLGEEATSNAPQPITEWFYPGDRMGYEFVY